MKILSRSFGLLAVVAGILSSPATAQTVGRVRQSLDKATGGATVAPGQPAAPAPAPAAPAPAVTIDPAVLAKAQAAAVQAAANKRNKEALVGADQRVVDFLKKRIEDGSPGAAFDLAKRYEEGKGVPADPVEARRLYKLAAERGNEDAKAWLEEHPEPKNPVVAAEKDRPAPPKTEAEAKPAEPVAKKPDK